MPRQSRIQQEGDRLMSRLAVVTIVSSLDAKCPSVLIIECRERGITPPGYPGAIAVGGADGLLPPGIDQRVDGGVFSQAVWPSA